MHTTAPNPKMQSRPEDPQILASFLVPPICRLLRSVQCVTACLFCVKERLDLAVHDEHQGRPNGAERVGASTLLFVYREGAGEEREQIRE